MTDNLENPKITTAETQLYLVVAAEIELAVNADFRQIDRFKGMLEHKDAHKLPQLEEDLTLGIFELLEQIDGRIDAYRALISVIEEEQPPKWSDWA